MAGFQGIDEAGEIYTLGRGASDTTAVALAAVLGAKYCEINTDVDGIYTTDPRMLPEWVACPEHFPRVSTIENIAVVDEPGEYYEISTFEVSNNREERCLWK